MSIVKMDRMTIIGLTDDRESIIEALMNLGAVEVIPQAAVEQPDLDRVASPVDERISQAQNAMSRLEKAIAYAKKIDPKKKPMFTLRRPVAADDFIGAASREQMIMDQVTELERNHILQDELRVRQHRLASNNQLLEPWLDYDLDLSEQGTEHVRIFLGSLDNAALFGELDGLLREDAPETIVLQLDSGDVSLPGSQRVIVATWQPRSTIVQAGLRRLSFNPLPLQGESGTPRQIFSHNNSQLEEIAAELERISAENLEIAASLHDFETLYDNLTIRHDRLQEVAGLAGTRSTFWMEGWIPSHLVDAVSKIGRASCRERV